MKRSSLSLVGLLSLTMACGGDSPPAAAPTPPAAASASTPAPLAVTPAALDLDPVAVALGELGAEPAAAAAAARQGVEHLCVTGLARARLEAEGVRSLGDAAPAQLTWDNTLGALDRVRTAIRNSADASELFSMVHPDPQTRERAKACGPAIERFDTELWLDATVAKVVKRYADKGEELRPVQRRLLERVQREFRRNGLELSNDQQTKLRELNERITALSQEFDANIAASKGQVRVKPSALEGLPPEWIATHPAEADGLVTVTTDYPDYFPVMTYARDRAFALELYKQFDNRAADKNITVLEQILQLRHDKAKLLGFATWADYVLETRMAKDASTVATFLSGLKEHVAKKASLELKELRAQRVKLGGKASDPFYPSDRLYLEDQVRKAKYGLDSQEVSQYFEVTAVKAGVLALTAEMFGLRYQPVQAVTWHAEVEAVDVFDAQTDQRLGRFYFDLHPRADKYKHAAVFSIRDAVTLANGERLSPIAAIVCNFPRPGGGAPALMAHHDVATFFHEFGHVLHHLLSEAEFSTFSGTNVARDFVESPSQMLEEWAWNKSTLDKFAKHHQTSAPLPKKLHDAMLRSRSFGRGVGTQRQLFLAGLDQAYHTRAPGFDTTKVLEEINDTYTPFRYVEGTHFQASFGHLMGYDAGYYGYQWALSIARDLFTRFEKEGLLNPQTAREYRQRVLAQGSSKDERELVADFLGRPLSEQAYKAFLVQ